MTFGQSELVFALLLALILAIVGLAAVVLSWRRAVSLAAVMAKLSDGVVMIVDGGTVVEASAQAETLLGATVGRQARAVLGAFLGQESGSETGLVLTALAGLEQNGDAIHLRTRDQTGRPFELTGQPQGSQIRLVLREGWPADPELNSARSDVCVREQTITQQEIETSTLGRLLADAPIAVWNRAPDGSLLWSTGNITTDQGTTTAKAAGTLAANRAAAKPAEPVTQHEPMPNDANVERFRLELAGASDSETIVLDAIETDSADGTRIGLALDASGAHGVEQTLERFVRTMTETFAHLNVGLAIFNRNQTLAMFNPALVEIWKADPAWLAGRPSLRDILDSLRANRRTPEVPDFHAWRRQLSDLFDNTETADYDELWHLGDGVDIRVLARSHPHGALAFIFEDVTERLRLGQQFRNLVELRRATLDRLDEGIAVFGPDGLLQLVNSGFHDIWGTDVEMVRTSMHASELLPLVRGLTVETEVWQRLMTYITGGDSRQAWAARLTLGTGRILSARFASLPDGSTLAVFSDVTDNARMATALRERNDALESVAEMRSAVLDQISHRLRTPLNTIFGFGQLIADSRFGALTDAQRVYAQAILESARHLMSTIDDVTELAALEIHSMHEEGSGLSLGETLTLTGHLLDRRAAEEGVILRIIAPDDECKTDCDIGRLRQIVFNMTTDAINRCTDGSTIDLGARLSTDGGVEIYTLEVCGDGITANPALAEAASLTLPFLHRLVAREGGSFELRSVAGNGPGETFLSAVCHLRQLAPPAGPANPAVAE